MSEIPDPVTLAEAIEFVRIAAGMHPEGKLEEVTDAAEWALRVLTEGEKGTLIQLIQSKWKHNQRVWTMVMDGDVDASLMSRFLLVPLDPPEEETE